MIKLTKEFHSRALADLHRPHPFADERIGFLACRSLTRGRATIFFGCDYMTVADDDYLEDDSVGARIGGNAIRAAMHLAISRMCSVFQVHTHGGTERPVPSPSDRAECPGVARSLHNAFPGAPHGWLILGHRSVYAEAISPANTWHTFTELSVVGMPMIFREKKPSPIRKVWWNRRAASHDRYSRQGFLGPDSQSMIGSTRVGIIGLGGGGSHVVQQLAHLGFRDFVLCDPDRVSHSNLNRLVGATRRDASWKRSKVRVATRVIRGLHASATIRSHASVWQACAGDIADCDIVVGCLDSFEQRNSIEAHCRRHLIPYVDIGMEVGQTHRGRQEIYGQVVLSLPGRPCLQCACVVTEANLAREVGLYGQAGPRPQVVWPNGVLASAAVGHCVSLVTGWSGTHDLPIRLDFQGSTGCLIESPLWQSLRGIMCPHYPIDQAGEPVYRPM